MRQLLFSSIYVSLLFIYISHKDMFTDNLFCFILSSFNLFFVFFVTVKNICCCCVINESEKESLLFVISSSYITSENVHRDWQRKIYLFLLQYCNFMFSSLFLFHLLRRLLHPLLIFDLLRANKKEIFLNNKKLFLKVFLVRNEKTNFLAKDKEK